MSNRMYVATRKGLFTLDRAGASSGGAWLVSQAAFVGDNVSYVTHDPRDGTVYAALAHGHFGVKLHRSRDGVSWEEWSTPSFPEQTEADKDNRCPMRNIPIPWNVELIWSLVPGGSDQPGLLWCGTIPGALFCKPGADADWHMVRSLWDRPGRKKWFGGGYDYPGIHSICVDPRDSKRVLLGVSCGGVWVTPDAGETWACKAHGMTADYMPPESKVDPEIQDPHCLVQCAAQPDHLWVQHHNGVFCSTDDSERWQEVTTVRPSKFGFAVAVHPADPKTAWFLPGISDQKRTTVDGRVVVARTRDGGESFEVLREGLPQEHAYDLVFRHGLDVDETGERLAFGSTTGSLWHSEDQGNRWQLVTAHLPPIHCVRFVKSGR